MGKNLSSENPLSIIISYFDILIDIEKDLDDEAKGHNVS